MNTTLNILMKNLSGITNESWFIPIDIITNLCIFCSLILAIIFFVTIFFSKICRTVPMMLVTNSCFSGIIFGIVIYYMNLFKLLNDYNQIEYQDMYCSFRGYAGYASCSILNNSFLLQSIYRFVRIIYPSRLIFQSYKFQFFLILFTWIFGILYPIKFLFTNEIVYNIENQICQLPLHLSFSIIYMANFAYILPVSLTFIIYLKLVLYVKKMSKRVTVINRLHRAKQELKMLRRTVILVAMLIIYCFPYAMFIFFSFFLVIPKYHFRISYVFIDVSYLFMMIALFQFTDPIKTSITKILFKQPNHILPTTNLKDQNHINIL
ncbi:unnamed protein product [Adineta steineri]|uniref:G-protein coupled receptors family 1 profile domain-containing protein n=1 Tax=Adineta steineri TaxID=433720 RepID=A0A814QTQ4_9BILA|nr:unnamed protein product [Adineta steineri]CAF3915145.1 unnamed protein product [Adineta steineri]